MSNRPVAEVVCVAGFAAVAGSSAARTFACRVAGADHRKLGRRAAVGTAAAAGLAAGVYARIVRPWHLRWGATCTEAERVLPGDTLVSRPQLEGDRARLVVRLRLRISTWRGWPFLAAMDVGDFIFMRRMLLGIRECAERGIATGVGVAPARPVPVGHRAGSASARS